MFAVKRWPAAWRPMFERGDHVALMLPITPATPPRRSSDCSAASPTSWRTSPRPTTKFPRPFAPSAPTGASINRSRPTHRARLHPRQALIALGPTRRVHPFSGVVLVFRSKRGDKLKILHWDTSGLVLVWKQLEGGAFRWPPITDGTVRLSAVQFAALFSGLDYARVQSERRIPRPTAAA